MATTTHDSPVASAVNTKPLRVRSSSDLVADGPLEPREVPVPYSFAGIAVLVAIFRPLIVNT
jgi:hypothetical protein